jgi:hypothetical protein
MIKELVHDPIFLAGKSEIATKEDLHLAQDPNWKIDDMYACGVNFPFEFENLLKDSQSN